MQDGTEVGVDFIGKMIEGFLLVAIPGGILLALILLATAVLKVATWHLEKRVQGGNQPPPKNIKFKSRKAQPQQNIKFRPKSFKDLN